MNRLLSACGVPYISVTGRTAQGLIAVDPYADHVLGKRLMTCDAVCLGNIGIERTNTDWFMEISQRKGYAVIEPVDTFDKPLFNERCMGRVAVIAGCNPCMAGMLPGIELLAHDVAVIAGLRIIRKVRSTFGIVECEHA